MATTRKWTQQGSSVTLMTTELNSLAAAGLAVSASTINNSQGQTNLDGYTRCFLEANLAAPSAGFAANSTLDVWFLRQVGTQVEDGSASVTPARRPDASLGMQTTVAAQHIIADIMLPPGTLSILAKNNQLSGSQALAASGNTLTLQAYTDQGV